MTLPYTCIKLCVRYRLLQRKPLPVLADSAAYAKATSCQGILVPAVYAVLRRAKGYRMFLDFTIRAFLNIPAKDGIFDQHLASSIQHLSHKGDCLTPILIIS